MADNFDFTEGSGKSGAADDVGGVLFAKVKLDLGTDGVSAPALAGAGAVATGVQRITLASDDPAVALLITIDSDTNTIQSDTTSIDGKITACNTGAVVLATGSAAIGKLAANTGVDIGDVDVTSVIPGVTATSLGKARDSALGATDTGVMALVVRDDTLTTLTPVDGDYVPLRVGSTGKLHVTDANITACNTGAVVISSGTVTTVSTVTNLAQMGGVAISLNEGALDTGTQRVTLATDDDAVAHLATIAGDTTSMDGKITACNTGAVVISSGTITTVSTVTNLAQLGGTAITMDEGVHDAGCQRVTIATDDDGVLSLGIIDGWDATHASAASADGPQVMGAGYSAGLPTDVGADGDAARICTDRHGRIVRGLMPQWFNEVYDSADASGEGETVKAATPSRKIYILSLTISVDAEMWVKLQDEDSNAITCKHWFKAGGGKTITYPPEAPLVLDVVNKALEVITEGAGNIGVEITGYLAV